MHFWLHCISCNFPMSPPKIQSSRNIPSSPKPLVSLGWKPKSSNPLWCIWIFWKEWVNHHMGLRFPCMRLGYENARSGACPCPAAAIFTLVVCNWFHFTTRIHTSSHDYSYRWRSQSQNFLLKIPILILQSKFPPKYSHACRTQPVPVNDRWRHN